MKTAFKSWTIRYSEKEGNDFHYEKVVARTISAAIAWVTSNCDIEVDQIDYVSSENINIAEE